MSNSQTEILQNILIDELRKRNEYLESLAAARLRRIKYLTSKIDTVESEEDE